MSLQYYKEIKRVYSGHLRASLKRPNYQGALIFQVSLQVNGYFGTITKCPDYGIVPNFKCGTTKINISKA